MLSNRHTHTHTHRQTHTQTHRSSTVTLAAHAHRGLTTGAYMHFTGLQLVDHNLNKALLLCTFHKMRGGGSEFTTIRCLEVDHKDFLTCQTRQHFCSPYLRQLVMPMLPPLLLHQRPRCPLTEQKPLATVAVSWKLS